MKKLRDFIQGKKVERKFKNLGQGQSLVGGSNNRGQAASSASSGQRQQQPNVRHTQESEERRKLAAQAIEKRLNQGKGDGMTASQRAIQLQAKREIEEEQRRLNPCVEQTPNLDVQQPRARSEEPEADSSILYTCDLLDDLALPKSQMYQAIETFLRAQLDEEPLDAAVLMLFSLNPASRVEPTVQTLQKYLNNITSDLGEIKFRKIRTSNKVFIEKVAPIAGAIEFLNAVGFEERKIPNADTKEIETFMVLDDPNCALINDALEELANANMVSLKLFRDPKVFIADLSKPIPSPEIPPDFFQLSTAEVRAMQQEKKLEVERMTTLRTRKMREEDEQALAAARGVKTNNVYKYTLIRICFPNSFILQGVFNVHESIYAVREFVSQRLELESGVFSLAVPGAGALLEADKSLMQHGLLPCALLHFRWDNDTVDYFEANNLQQTFLLPFLQNEAERLAPN